MPLPGRRAVIGIMNTSDKAPTSIKSYLSRAKSPSEEPDPDFLKDTGNILKLIFTIHRVIIC